MIGHSIYACVDGGSNTDVANVLLNKKSGGCAYNNGASGNPQSVSVTVPFSGQVMDILFDRPDIIQILVQVTVKNNSALQDITDLVKQAILDYAAGNINGDSGLQIGTSVSPFELAGAINIEQPSIFVTNLEIAYAGMSPVFGTSTLAISIFQKAQIMGSSISVNIV